MMLRHLLVFSMIFVAPAFGQTLAPDIAPLAARYEADIKALDAARAVATARIQQAYLADLTAAEKSATATGKVAEVTAILKTREAVTAGKATSSAASGSSPSLQRRHAEYFAALSAADRELFPRYQRTSADFLRSLATVEARLPASSPVREQIAGLKTKLSTGAVDASALVGHWTWRKSDWKGIRNLNADGTFIDEHGKTAGKWSATSSELKLDYEGGATERLELPPKNGEIKGVAKDGRPLMATKQRE